MRRERALSSIRMTAHAPPPLFHAKCPGATLKKKEGFFVAGIRTETGEKCLAVRFGVAKKAAHLPFAVLSAWWGWWLCRGSVCSRRAARLDETCFQTFATFRDLTSFARA